MATYTTLSIQNKALLLCGASPITSQAQDSANARSIDAVYEIARKGFLTENRWTFSTTRTTLSTVSTTAIDWFYPEESYLYDRPSDATRECLRVWGMSDIYAIWREEGEYIISDSAKLQCRWTYDEAEVGLWRPKAVTAFMDKLCSDISFMILNSAKKAEDFLKKYEKVSLPAAMTENSQTGFQQEVIDDDWERGKLSNGGNPSRSYS